MFNLPDGSDKKLLLLTFAAIFLLGIGLGMELLPWLLKLPSRPPAAPVLSGGVSGWEEPALWPRLRAASRKAASSPQAGPSKPLGYDELRSLLASRGAPPSAREFGRVFLQDPRLKKLWLDFRRTQDAQAFLRGLKASGGFAELLTQFGGNAGFREYAEGLAGHSRLAPLIQQLQPQVPEAPAPPAEEPGTPPDLPGAPQEAAGLRPLESPIGSAAPQTSSGTAEAALRILGASLTDRKVWGLGLGLDSRERAELNLAIRRSGPGADAWKTCLELGLRRECSRMVQRCMELPACVQWVGERSRGAGPGGPQLRSTCGDGWCNSALGEGCEFCPEDCLACPAPSTCGQAPRACDLTESCNTCPGDCGPCAS